LAASDGGPFRIGGPAKEGPFVFGGLLLLRPNLLCLVPPSLSPIFYLPPSLFFFFSSSLFLLFLLPHSKPVVKPTRIVLNCYTFIQTQLRYVSDLTTITT
jgi:hypothetical protein